MRKRTLLLLLFTIVSVLVYLTPQLLNYKHFQDRITRELISSVGVDLRFSSIQWRWLPFPAFHIKEIQSESDFFHLYIPEVKITPNFKNLIGNQDQIGRIRLFKPTLTLKKTLNEIQKNPTSNSIELPDLKVAISEGTILVPQMPLMIFGTPISLKPVSVNELNYKISVLNNRIKFTGDFKSNISGNVESIGRYDLNKNYYRLDFKVKNGNLAPLFNQADKNFQILESKLSSNVHLEGLGWDNFKLNLSQIQTPLSFSLLDHIYTVKTIGNIGFTKHSNEFFLGFEEINFEEPAAGFSGKVSKRFYDDSPEPVWIVDISGTDIDLGSIRKRILALWPKNKTAVNTCTIVQGGTAKTARYTFKGPVAHFEHLKNMKIWAEAVDVPIYLPDLNLFLDKASGPISIIDGYLAGRNLTADIKSSHGKNASLWLDLIGQDHAFYLDIDIDADLQNLKETLTNVVSNKNFQKELSEFSSISGRAKGKLTIGSTLENPETTVLINYVSAQGFYDRLPWPFKLDGIKLDIFPDEVIWKDFEALIGEQSVKHTSGKVYWDNEVVVEIDQLDATAELESFFDQFFIRLNDRKAYLKNSLKEVLSGITGKADFSGTEFKGPALHPDKWEFKTNITLADTTIQSPHLPPNMISEIVKGSISSDHASFSGIFDVFDQNIFMSGQYQHSLLDNWLGTIELNGIVKNELGEWLRTTDWVPLNFFPRFPLSLENFRITNKTTNFKYFDIKGEVISKKNQTGSKSMLVDISKQKNIALNILSFSDNENQGKFSYMNQPNSERSLLTWQGDLKMKTLDAFFEKNIFSEGHINGVFSSLSSVNQPDKVTYAGYLEATDITWNYFPESLPIIAKSFRINGENNTINVKNLLLEIDHETITGNGTVTNKEKELLLDISLSSQDLTINKIKHAFNQHNTYIKSFFSTEPTGNKTQSSSIPSWRSYLSGNLNFNIDQLHYISKPDQTTNAPLSTDAPHTYTLGNSYGNVDFDSGKIKLQLFPSDLCGMKLSGTYLSGEQKTDSFFDIRSGSDSLFFEDVLPCLGHEKSIIKGPFMLKGHLDGYPKHWHNGNLTLSSKEGIIKKMNILSKIFSVVNFTDLFTWGEPPDLDKKGLMYSDLIVHSHVENNTLIFDRTVLKGKGVNLTGRGTIDLSDSSFNSDMTFFVAPFKMIDSVVTNVPLVGKALGGKKESILTFPVGLSGPIRDAKVKALPAAAVGNAAVEFIMDTLTLPFRIFIPDKKDSASDKPAPLPKEFAE